VKVVEEVKPVPQQQQAPAPPQNLTLPLANDEEIQDFLQRFLEEKGSDEVVLANVIRVMGEQAIFSVRKKKQ